MITALRSLTTRTLSGRARDESGCTVRRCFDAAEVAAALEPYEPRTSQAVSDVYSIGLGPRRGRAWTIDRDRRLAAVVVTVRYAFDLWHGHVLLLDPAAAPTAARLIDESPAISLNGTGQDVGPVLAHVSRLFVANQLPWLVEEYPHEILQAPATDTRVATLADLHPLVELFRDYEYGYERTVGQLRTTLARLLREFVVVVAEADGEIVGATYLCGRTRRYVVGDGLTVRPDQRGKNTTWHIASRTQSIINSMGLGGVGFLAASNPVLVDTVVQEDRWITSRLVPKRSFRGQNRLRNLLSRGLSRQHRSPTYYRDPNDPSVQYIPKTTLTADGKLVRD